MAGITVGKLSEYVNSLEVSMQLVIDKLSQLDKGTVVTGPIVDKCAPIINPTNLFQACMAPTDPDTRDIKVEEIIQSLEKLRQWVKDMHEVLSGADSETEIPPVDEEPQP